MTPVIEEARRRQQRRRRIVTIGAVGLAAIACAAVLGASRLHSSGPTLSPTALAKGQTTTYTYVTTQRDGAITVRGTGSTVQATVVPSLTMRDTKDGSAGAIVVLDPKTGAVLVRVIKGRQPSDAPTMTTR
jgi:threonine dehydrogenase-like Zn-dependent dehydrogenase